MKYTPAQYARAFAKTLTPAKTDADGTRLAKNFARLIETNGDAHAGQKIFNATERAVREKTGVRKVTITAARAASPAAARSFRKLVSPHDIVEKRVDPSLIAGATILVNEELRFDGSLKRKLEKLFSF